MEQVIRLKNAGFKPRSCNDCTSKTKDNCVEWGSSPDEKELMEWLKVNMVEIWNDENDLWSISLTSIRPAIRHIDLTEMLILAVEAILEKQSYQKNTSQKKYTGIYAGDLEWDESGPKSTIEGY